MNNMLSKRAKDRLVVWGAGLVVAALCAAGVCIGVFYQPAGAAGAAGAP